jgi:hypothetical protein
MVKYITYSDLGRSNTHVKIHNMLESRTEKYITRTKFWPKFTRIWHISNSDEEISGFSASVISKNRVNVLLLTDMIQTTTTLKNTKNISFKEVHLPVETQIE